jgi:hypothetical protein
VGYAPVLLQEPQPQEPLYSQWQRWLLQDEEQEEQEAEQTGVA